MKFSTEYNILIKKKILIVYNSMEGWTAEEKKFPLQSVDTITKDLNKLNLSFEFISVEKDDIEKALKNRDPKTSVVFNWFEGDDERPASFQKAPPVYESLGFLYTGANLEGFKNTTFKTDTKSILNTNGVPTPISKCYDVGIEDLNDWHIFPAMVKPAYEHASFGISRQSVVDNPSELQKRIKYVHQEFSSPALVEEFLDSDEYNVAIWGSDKNPEILPISSLNFSYFKDYHDRICSYNTKWTENTSEYNNVIIRCPPINLSKEMIEKIHQVALAAYKLTKCRDYGRVDLRIKDDFPYVLDVNSNPDITIDAGFFRSSHSLGYSYGGTIAKICTFALSRAANN